MKRIFLSMIALLLLATPMSYAGDGDDEQKLAAGLRNVSVADPAMEAEIRREMEEDIARASSQLPFPFLMTPTHIYYLLQNNGLWQFLGVSEADMVLTPEETKVQNKINQETDVLTSLSEFAEQAVVGMLIAFKTMKEDDTCSKEAFQNEETQFVGRMGIAIEQGKKSRGMNETKIQEVSRTLLDIYMAYKGADAIVDPNVASREDSGAGLSNSGSKGILSSYELLDALWGIDGWPDKFEAVKLGQDLPLDFKQLAAIPELASALEGNFLVSQLQMLQLDRMNRESIMRQWRLVTYGRKLTQKWVGMARQYKQEILANPHAPNQHLRTEMNFWADSATIVSEMVKLAHPTEGDPKFPALAASLTNCPTKPGQLSTTACSVQDAFNTAGEDLFNGFKITEDTAAPFPSVDHKTTLDFFRRVQRKLGAELKPVPQISAHLQGAFHLAKAEAKLAEQRKDEKAQWRGILIGACMAVSKVEGALPLETITKKDVRLVEILQSFTGDDADLVRGVTSETPPSAALIDKLMEVYGDGQDSLILNGLRGVNANDLKPAYLKVLIPQLQAFELQTNGLHTVYQALVELRRHYEQQRVYTVQSMQTVMPVVDLDLEGNEGNLEVFIRGLLVSKMEDYLKVQLHELTYWCSPAGIAEMMQMPAPLSVWDIQQDVSAAFCE